ncbi:MAG: site-2 protease family protein [Sorangiineae bacterium]|nr:site-2 protease family protein [Polyangiaceae bacterium]MEB2322362.1 site-2 protease family protein [Sorangiineae bacterium]
MSDAPKLGFPPPPAPMHAVRPSAPPAATDRHTPTDAPASAEAVEGRPRGPALGIVLFGLTVLSVAFTGYFVWGAPWQFAVPLLAILVAHESGHYVAARLHRVPASLPYFIPLPFLSPFGTMGAVILMPERIRSRTALFDIGAAGPLAGMALAIPLMLYGLSLSTLGPMSAEPHIQEGQSLLYLGLKALVFGRIGPHEDVFLHPTALAAWTGFLVTFLNMLPFGQLDGGHVAYALFGERQNRFAKLVVWVPAVMVLVNLVKFGAPLWPAIRAHGLGGLPDGATGPLVSAVMTWVVLFVLLLLMARFSGAAHPHVDDHALSRGRKVLAGLTLALVVLLFMPSPWVTY